MHALYLWLLWLKAQLEKPETNPATIYREHRGAFMMGSQVHSYETVLWSRTDEKKNAVRRSTGEVFSYFNGWKLNKASRTKALRLVSKALESLSADGWGDIPF